MPALRRRQLARAGGLRRCSASSSTATPTCATSTCPTDFEGHPLPQGLPAAGPHREAVARHRRRRADARRGDEDEPADGGGRRRVTDTSTDGAQQLAYIAQQAADARVNVELETEGMTLNIGPQHPATHGTLRIVAQPRRRAGRLRPSRAPATCTGATRSSPRSAPTRRSPRWSTASTGSAASPTRCRSSSPPRS